MAELEERGGAGRGRLGAAERAGSDTARRRRRRWSARLAWALGVMTILALACGDDGGPMDGVDTDASLGGDGGLDADRLDGGQLDGGQLDDGAPPSGDDGGAASPGEDAGAIGDEVLFACAGDARLAVPADPAARGPWPVGARTVRVGRLTVEVWYPAAPGSDADAPAGAYDIREALPPMERRSPTRRTRPSPATAPASSPSTPRTAPTRSCSSSTARPAGARSRSRR